MARKVWACGLPLDENLQIQLREIIKQLGEHQAVKQLGVHMISIARAAAGFGLRQGTAHLLKARIASIEESKQKRQAA